MSFFNFKKSSSKKTGFTLIELLVAATILIVLTTIGMVSYRSAIAKSRDSKRKSDLETLRQALVLYKADNGRYPTVASSSLVSTLKSGGYLSADSSTDAMQDPEGGAYTYTYTGSGVTFTLTATLEDESSYTVASP